MFKKILKVVILTVTILIFTFLVVGLFIIFESSYKGNDEHEVIRTNVEPAWDYPKWVINGCGTAVKNPYMKTIYRCDLNLFLVEEGSWETSIKYFDYNGNDLVGECTPIAGNANCGDYKRECKNSELVCTRGYIELITNGKIYKKGGEIKINYNINYIHENRDSVLETYVEKRNNEKVWERFELLETRSIDGYFDKEINFILNWSNESEGSYRIVATDNLFEDLSSCDRKSGICDLKKYYSNEFIISSNENLDQAIENCAKEGELISTLPLFESSEEWRKCCDGLRKNKTFEVVDGSCSSREPIVCTNCPNGECGPGETECNCPQDCRKEADTSNWQTYQNKEYGYEIKLPENFDRRKSSTSEYWFGKLSIHMQGGQFLKFEYIFQDDIDNAGNFYCRENLKDDRCENLKWDNLEAIIDWRPIESVAYKTGLHNEGPLRYAEVDKSKAEIKHPNGGAIIISIDPSASSEDIKLNFRKIVSTFKFVESDLNNKSIKENVGLKIEKIYIYYILPFFILILTSLFIWRKMRKNRK